MRPYKCWHWRLCNQDFLPEMFHLVGCMASRSRVCVYSITSSSEKELLSCMGRSQKGLNNRVDKSKLTPIQTQMLSTSLMSWQMFVLSISLSCTSSVRTYKVLSVTVGWKLHIHGVGHGAACQVETVHSLC